MVTTLAANLLGLLKAPRAWAGVYPVCEKNSHKLLYTKKECTVLPKKVSSPTQTPEKRHRRTKVYSSPMAKPNSMRLPMLKSTLCTGYPLKNGEKSWSKGST